MAVIYKYFVPPGLFLVRSRCLISDFRPLTSDPCSLSPAFNGAFPIRARHIDRQHFQSVPLRILDNRERLIKTHRLVVERRRGKRRQVMTLEIGAGVSNQRKAGGV